MDNPVSKSRARRGFLLAAVVFFTTSAGAAMAQERWAALSLLGDRMTLVTARMQTGTNTNPNMTHPIPMQENVLDKLALRAAGKAKGVPELVPLGLRDPKFYEVQDRLFASDGQALLASLRKALDTSKVTHILLISKLRADAAFPIREGYIGIGAVEGLGFYVDRKTRLRRTDTGVDDTGYLAPFAYYRLALFDLAGGKVVAQEDVRTSSAYPLASSGESDVWNVLTPEQKIDEMERLLNKSMGPALGRLAAKRERG